MNRSSTAAVGLVLLLLREEIIEMDEDDGILDLHS